MAHSSLTGDLPRQQTWVISSLTLAFWQLRYIWRLLSLTMLGMIAAVVLTCAIPLFSWMTMSAGLRGIFVSDVDQSLIVIHSKTSQVSTSLLKETNTQVGAITQRHLQQYIIPSSERFVVSVPALSIPGRTTGTGAQQLSDKMSLWGYNMRQVASHVRVLEGNLPDPNAKQLEIALTRKSAQQLKVQVGSTLTLPIASLNPPLRVAAIIEQTDTTDPFWYGTNLEVQLVPNAGYAFTALLARDPFIAVLDTLRNSDGFSKADAAVRPDYFWTYQMDVGKLDADRIQSLKAGLQGLTNEIPIYVNSPGFFDETTVNSPLNNVSLYQDHMSVAQIPVVVLAVLVIGLLLFFVSLMAELLVERQTSNFAILRSRGASVRQIFGAVFTQSLLLAVIALIVGPLLALPAVKLLVQLALGSQHYNAMSLLDANPMAALWNLRWLILGTIGAAVMVMTFSAFSAIRQDVLSIRRSAGRNQKKPFWQRFYLDAVAVILSLAGYIIAVFVINQGLLDAKLRVLLQGPLILMSSIFLLLAGTLLFLRLFPILLNTGMRFANKGRGVVSVLAFSMMSRSPHQALRMILLLTFALGFAVFSLTFNASQTLHMRESAAYQTGADFSGEVVSSKTDKQLSTLQGQYDAYSKLKGVNHAASGFVTFGHVSESNQEMPVKVLAIDTQHFVQATTWGTTSQAANVQTQLEQVAKRRGELLKQVTPVATKTNTTSGQTTPIAPNQIPLPALVDTAAWNALQLTEGREFTLFGVQGNITFVAIGQVPSIPSVNDRAGDGKGELGILVDYTSFSVVYNQNAHNLNSSADLVPNYIWLQSKDDPSSVTALRNTLSQGKLRLGALFDRRALQDSMGSDPLYLNLIGVLALGALAPILLALVGNLLASWWNTRNRVSNFVVLRALGTGPRQLINILFCEQFIIYTTAIVLGILFGLLLSSLTLPSLVFTKLPEVESVVEDASNPSIYAMQNVPPVQLVVPPTLLLALACLALFCFLALFMMVRIVMRATVNDTLRLNSD